jgi:hypothetical protein
MKKLLFFLFIFFGLSVFSQSREIDKTFINTNYHAILLIQKHVVAKQLTNYHDDLLKLISWQAESVNMYSGNKTKAMSKANIVRRECLKFMEMHTPNSLPYFEKDFSRNININSETESNSLSVKQTEEIKALDVLDLNCTKKIALQLQ